MIHAETAEIPARRPNRRPTHPGALLRDTVIPALGIGVTGAADALGVTRQQIHRVLAEQSGVSPVMALRLGKPRGNGPAPWVNMQVARDMWDARRELGDAIDAIPTFPAD